MRREHWDRKYAETEQLWAATPNRSFAAEAVALPPGRALDLACGEGRHAVWLAERGPGLEIEKAERVLRAVDDADRPAIDALVRARRRLVHKTGIR